MSLLALAVCFGVYKERIDRHERWFQMLVGDNLMRAWKSGGVDQGSYTCQEWIIENLPDDVKVVLRDIGKGRAKMDKVMDQVLQKLNGRIEALARESTSWRPGPERDGLTPMAMLGALTAYALQGRQA